MCSHIPDRGEQMVRYYGYYSNVSRGKRKETEDDGVPCIPRWGSGLPILHSCPLATEVFNSSDSPADAGIMNSQMLSNFPHPIPMIHIGTSYNLLVDRKVKIEVTLQSSIFLDTDPGEKVKFPQQCQGKDSFTVSPICTSS